MRWFVHEPGDYVRHARTGFCDISEGVEITFHLACLSVERADNVSIDPCIHGCGTAVPHGDGHNAVYFRNDRGDTPCTTTRA